MLVIEEDLVALFVMASVAAQNYILYMNVALPKLHCRDTEIISIMRRNCSLLWMLSAKRTESLIVSIENLKCKKSATCLSTRFY